MCKDKSRPRPLDGASAELPQPDAVQCEATTLTEYSQRNNVARVSGSVSIANCPAGSTGTFNVVARVRDDSGEIKPVEFIETWQRDDASDVAFNNDYPIGENVELVRMARPLAGDRLAKRFDYFVATYRFGMNEAFPAAPVVHEIGRDGAIFTTIKAAPPAARPGPRRPSPSRSREEREPSEDPAAASSN